MSSVSYDGRWLWLAYYYDQLLVAHDPRTGTAPMRMRLPESPLKVFWQGQDVWIATWKGVMQLRRDGRPVTTIDLKVGQVASVTSIGASAWVIGEKAEQHVDLGRRRADAPIQLPEAVLSSSVSANRLWLTPQATGGLRALSFEGGEPMLTMDNDGHPDEVVFDGARCWFVSTDRLQAWDVTTRAWLPPVRSEARLLNAVFDGARLWTAEGGDIGKSRPARLRARRAEPGQSDYVIDFDGTGLPTNLSVTPERIWFRIHSGRVGFVLRHR